MTVVDTTDCWFSVALTIGVESWLTEICCEGGIRQPSRGIQELRFSFGHLFGCFPLGGRHLTLLHRSLRGSVVRILHDSDGLPLGGCSNLRQSLLRAAGRSHSRIAC